MFRNTYKILLFAITVSLLQSCLKEEECWEQEKRQFEQYLLENNITTEPTASGLYYIPLKEGDGLRPTLESVVEFEYTGELIDGTVFGTTDSAVAASAGFGESGFLAGPIRLVVGGALPGLSEGFPLMKEGGEAMFIMPSDLGYGRNSIGAVPSCASLIFTIDLQRVIDDPYEDEIIMIKNFMDENEYEAEPTESGLYYIEQDPGVGDLITLGNRVQIYYTGYFLDGRVFDSNVGDAPISFRVPSDNIIEGWNEGVQLMRKEAKGVLIIPFDLAYGNEGSSNISPFMTLVFEIEITDVN